jgi:hypothetical protein
MKTRFQNLPFKFNLQRYNAEKGIPEPDSADAAAAAHDAVAEDEAAAPEGEANPAAAAAAAAEDVPEEEETDDERGQRIARQWIKVRAVQVESS